MSMIGLNEKGNLFIPKFDTQNRFYQTYEYLEKELNYFLTGKKC